MSPLISSPLSRAAATENHRKLCYSSSDLCKWRWDFCFFFFCFHHLEFACLLPQNNKVSLSSWGLQWVLIVSQNTKKSVYLPLQRPPLCRPWIRGHFLTIWPVVTDKICNRRHLNSLYYFWLVSTVVSLQDLWAEVVRVFLSAFSVVFFLTWS